MLSLHPQRGKLRYANNLLPTKDGGLATRPGAIQVLSGSVDKAQPWGNRVLFERAGRIVLWDGALQTDIAPAGHGLQATPFQALTENAQREDRLYVGDAVNPLWYIVRRSGVYARHDIANSVADENGIAYPVPVAQVVGTWRGRLWTANGTNRVQHCQFDDPDYWDPLWTPEFQGKKAGRVVALEPTKGEMVVGLTSGAWTIRGDSHLNWQRDPVLDTSVAGPDAMAGDDERAFWISSIGLHQLGSPEPLSEDLKNLWASTQYPADLVLDTRRQLLLLLVGGRLFAMHLARPGVFGEIVGHAPRGLIQLDDYTGWYGASGLWVLGARDMPDRYLDGTASAFTSLYDTWEDIPNVHGDGRALLRSTKVVVKGSDRGNLTYTVTAAGPECSDTFTDTASLTDTTPQRWTDQIAGLTGEDWPTPPVRREFPAAIAGTTFRHQLSAPCHMEVAAFVPDYKFAAQEDDA